MSELKFAAWSVAESPVAIEYSLVVIEEIRHAVAEGFQRLSRGGIEVGGILYGTRDGRTVRILAMRPIACESLEIMLNTPRSWRISSAAIVSGRILLSANATSSGPSGFR